MLIGISTKEDVLNHFTKWLEREYPIIDEDDELYNRLILASVDDLINDHGADYWGDQSVKTLFQRAKEKLQGL
tara:strand:- start:467 stop:685 length:219 start_codon:yes stop_codon:yes gene_type:complete